VEVVNTLDLSYSSTITANGYSPFDQYEEELETLSDYGGGSGGSI
jgi:hypothetical protein